ncbi:hypothetical protein J2Z23_002446 [Lederbergia galactosidilyticus]|uniref:hypothetical protein n=1 Tax=Lederbergia galactosidilytica TaxID=217031 RepID=UPI001AE85C19|nr:hypothetical protein [Lederbergia galactosidilytica]MBP1915465.1 hypothetical protein [Lederbergia galactosidilytica]
MKAIVKKNSVFSYARPSKKAIKVNQFNKNDEIIVYPLIKGWFELRPVDTDGIMNTEFIAESEIKFVK